MKTLSESPCILTVLSCVANIFSLLGYRCAYVFQVVSTFSCPRRCETIKILNPISINREAWECRIKSKRLDFLRHSHVSLLISMGFSAVSIGNRVGHESVDITYRYAHMFPTEQSQMAMKLDEEFKEGTEK